MKREFYRSPIHNIRFVNKTVDGIFGYTRKIVCDDFLRELENYVSSSNIRH